MFVYVDASVMNNERSSKGFFYAWMTLKITNHTFDIVFEANNYDVWFLMFGQNKKIKIKA